MNPAEPDKAPPGFVSGDLGIEPEAVERIEALAGDYADSVFRAELESVEYGRIVAALDRLGEREFVATAAMSGRLLDRRFVAMRGLLNAKAPMARRLGDLRKAVADLDPGKLKLGGKRGPHKDLDELNRYFGRFERMRGRIEETLAQLTEGRMILEQDNAAIGLEQRGLAAEMESLRQYAYLASKLDEQLTARLDALAITDRERADALRADLLHAVRRRRQEILTELAVAIQGFAALRIVDESNDEVIRSIAAATTTTTTALHTAVMVAQAAASQHAAIEQAEMAGRAAAQIRGGAARLQANLPDSAERVEILRRAWGDVRSALDQVEARKAQALRTISDADRELTHPTAGPAERQGDASSG